MKNLSRWMIMATLQCKCGKSHQTVYPEVKMVHFMVRVSYHIFLKVEVGCIVTHKQSYDSVCGSRVGAGAELRFFRHYPAHPSKVAS